MHKIASFLRGNGARTTVVENNRLPGLENNPIMVIMTIVRNSVRPDDYTSAIIILISARCLLLYIQVVDCWMKKSGHLAGGHS